MRYIVVRTGRPVGWVHAATAEEAIRKVCKVTENDPQDCVAFVTSRQEGAYRGATSHIKRTKRTGDPGAACNTSKSE